MSRRVGLLGGAVALLLTAPGSALALGTATNPLTPGLPQASTTTTSSTAPVIINTSPTSGASGLSGTNAVAIGIGALIVIGGISFFIWRDARKRAPVRGRAAAATAGPGGRSGSKAPPKQRKLSPAERRRRKRGRAR